jgi:hypothetical protein
MADDTEQEPDGIAPANDNESQNGDADIASWERVDRVVFGRESDACFGARSNQFLIDGSRRGCAFFANRRRYAATCTNKFFDRLVAALRLVNSEA